MYLLTNVFLQHRLGKRYRRRWKIEYCFKHLKSNGFNLEAMNFKDPQKVRLMVALVVVAYIIALRQGLMSMIKKKKKVYRDGTVYWACSIFRIGIALVAFYAASFNRFNAFIQKLHNHKLHFV